MEYTYIVEEQTNKDYIPSDISVLHILCYHITNDSKYPFLQFMMEKTPTSNNLIKEKFTLPYIEINGLSMSFDLLVVEKVKSLLNNIGCNGSKTSDEMYKGIVYDNLDRSYALINITGIDISGINLYRTSTTWFALPTEIINVGEICNIQIDEMIVELFTLLPQLGILTNSKNNEKYILPDAVYTGGEHKNVIFNAVFGNNKTKEYANSGDYYYFYRSFNDAIKDGGWIKNGGIRPINKNIKSDLQSPSNRVLIDNEYGRYIKGGINRYALFSEGRIYIEPNREFGLTDTDMELLYPEPVVIICYLNDHEIKPDILVKVYDNFASLSYHILDKGLLGEMYICENNKKYMIL